MMHRQLILALSAVVVMVMVATLIAQPTDRPETDGPRRGRHDGDGLRRRGPASQPGRPGRRPGSRRGRITPEQETELLTVLKDKRPDYHERLTRLKKEDPRRYRGAIHMSWRWYQRWKKMSPKEKAALKKLEEARIAIGRITRAIREAKKPATAEQKRELLAAVTKAFEAEQARQAIRIEKLAKEIQRIKEELRDRLDRRKELISERLDRTLRATTQPARRHRRGGRPRATTQPTKSK